MTIRGTRSRLVAALAAAAGVLASAPAAQADPVVMCNVPIKASDGTILRANIALPSGGARFQTVLTVTGYNKDSGNPTGRSCTSGGALASLNMKWVEAGYASMIVDDRGTGASQGAWDSWGRRTQEDYTDLLDWIQAQPWSDGKVATTGTSYMGITSLLVALKDAERVKAGKPRAVRAVWADVPMADAYRDVTFHGGATDSGFMPLWLGLVNALSGVPPSTWTTDPGDAASTWPTHLYSNGTFAGTKLAEAATGGEAGYDGDFYRTRSPVERIKQLEIPVAWTGGWWDIFQRGEPLLYEKMTRSKQRKFWMLPMYHGAPTAATWNEQKIGTLGEVQVKWFDRWLRKRRNGVDKLPPVNLYTMGADRWTRYRTWPVPKTKYTRFFLNGQDGGGLSTARPAENDADTAPLLPVSSPCSRLTAQWTAGLASSCQTDNSTFDSSALTYTTQPLDRDTEVTGLITADLYAELTSKDATLVATLNDVSPEGESTQITAGFLLASQRALDTSKTKYDSPKRKHVLRPWHPFTKESQRPVTPNEVERYLIEIYPTSHVFEKGHRLRLTLASANTPTTSTPVPSVLDSAGGQIKLLHGPTYRSAVTLPLR